MRANKKELRALLLAGTIYVFVIVPTFAPCFAESMEARPFEAPTPGGASMPPPAPPATTTTSAASASSSAPVPGSSDMQSGAPGRLTSVISLHDAQIWVDRFKNQTTTVTPQSMEQLAAFYEWVLELLDEHNRLSNIFSKNENTKAMADAERQTVTKFSHLKIEVLLLKAELLIKLNRYAEAIVPLVDIVNAEPLSAAGKEAYKDLQDIGFSEIPAFTSQTLEDLQPVIVAPASKPAPVKTATFKTIRTTTAARTKRTRYAAYRVR